MNRFCKMLDECNEAMAKLAQLSLVLQHCWSLIYYQLLIDFISMHICNNIIKMQSLLSHTRHLCYQCSVPGLLAVCEDNTAGGTASPLLPPNPLGICWYDTRNDCVITLPYDFHRLLRFQPLNHISTFIPTSLASHLWASSSGALDSSLQELSVYPGLLLHQQKLYDIVKKSLGIYLVILHDLWPQWSVIIWPHPTLPSPLGHHSSSFHDTGTNCHAYAVHSWHDFFDGHPTGDSLWFSSGILLAMTDNLVTVHAKQLSSSTGISNGNCVALTWIYQWSNKGHTFMQDNDSKTGLYQSKRQECVDWGNLSCSSMRHFDDPYTSFPCSLNISPSHECND